MTAETELTDEQAADLLAEYARLCKSLGYPLGTSLRTLQDHAFANGALVLEFIPRLQDREAVIARHMFLRGAS